MIPLDMRTVLFSYALSNAICAAVMASLWFVNRRRSAGLGLWVADYVLQLVAVTLLVLRGIVPVWVSILFASPLVIGGAILLYRGLEVYTGKTGPQRHNVVLLAAFTLVHAHFTFTHPSLAARNISASVALVAICGQCAWLMLRRVDAELRPDTRLVGLIFSGYCLFSVARVFSDLAVPPGPDVFIAGVFDVLVVMGYQMLFVALTFSLSLMVNRRLVAALERDIAERTRAEEALRESETRLEERVYERTAELEASMRELEAFSYSVSHDLRSPLRAVNGFSRILLDEYGPRLDAEAQRLCSVIGASARDMGRLIDDLLGFSRLGRASLQPASVDMAALAESVYVELTTEADRARIAWRVGPLPKAVCDPALIRQVWANLLGNAVKFSSKRERAEIEATAERQGDVVVYSVRDNGAGFDKRYAHKLFGVFQRLHGEREFEGTGVGLAIVQRVIQRHGGRVWAEGDPDRGATFHFALPVAAEPLEIAESAIAPGGTLPSGERMQGPEP